MKVCVYTICKNEIDNIDQWLDCMNEADYMVVVDTGSVDGSYEKLKEAQGKYKNLFIYKESINPWRFDIARNRAMSYIPTDTNACVSMDMDEVFMHKGWCNYLKDVWSPNYELGTLIYIDNKENSVYNKKVAMPRTKIHKLDAIWKYPLHEIPVTNINDEFCAASLDFEKHLQASFLDLREADWENLVVVHNSKKTSSENYVKLADLRLKEYPGVLSQSIKIQELFKTKQYDLCYNYIIEVLNEHEKENDLIFIGYKSLFNFYKGYIEEYYFNNINLAAETFKKSLSYNPKNEMSVYELVRIYYARNLNNKVIDLLKPLIDDYYNNRLSRYLKKYNELYNWFYDEFNRFYNLCK